jgi:hypothetical protein
LQETQGEESILIIIEAIVVKSDAWASENKLGIFKAQPMLLKVLLVFFFVPFIHG